MELSDRQLVGERLSELELEFVRSHELDCAQCGREAAVFRELRTAPLHLVPSEEDVQRILLQAEQTHADPPLEAAPSGWWTRTSTQRVAAVAALVALAAGLWLYLKAEIGGEARPGATVALTTQGASSATTSRSTPKPAPLTPPSGAPAGDGCSSLVDGIVLCLAAGSEVGEVHTAGPQRTVELRRGRAVASLEPQPPGTSFSITTAAGKVTAVGTIFSVEIGQAGEAYASVTHGKVKVEGLGASSSFLLQAGQTVRLGDTEVSALPALEAQQDLDVVARWAAGISGGRGELHAPFEQRESPASEAKTANGGARPQLQEELGHARALRMAGQFARAAAVYRSIYSRNPRSEGGRAALMSLASLQLSSLGDARGALTSYESYLAGGGGALSEQAEYGRIRALRQLGRSAEEREATRRFIARYPNAPETRLLKRRDAVPSRR
jgi:hypothetical protein